MKYEKVPSINNLKNYFRPIEYDTNDKGEILCGFDRIAHHSIMESEVRMSLLEELHYTPSISHIVRHYNPLHAPICSQNTNKSISRKSKIRSYPRSMQCKYISNDFFNCWGEVED